jgi:hypothetical protein
VTKLLMTKAYCVISCWLEFCPEFIVLDYFTNDLADRLILRLPNSYKFFAKWTENYGKDSIHT